MSKPVTLLLVACLVLLAVYLAVYLSRCDELAGGSTNNPDTTGHALSPNTALPADTARTKIPNEPPGPVPDAGGAKPKPGHVVAGILVDTEGAPQAGTILELGETRVRTDAQGRFRCEGVVSHRTAAAQP